MVSQRTTIAFRITVTLLDLKPNELKLYVPS